MIGRFLFVVLLVSLISLSSFVDIARAFDLHGMGNPPCTGQDCEIPSFFSVTCENSSGFVCILDKVLNILLDISIPIVAIMVVIGAIQIMTAAGSEEMIKRGRKTITYAVIGFAIMLLATSVVPIVTSLLK